ncbi:hypothetical protein RRG08_033030 [Elysia crispata]|uniref:Uncharacterized protein n=1 Tax=Elysia crispata TaxID=231223 RepID=A0AAE0Z618_9GAST|nr:hypothetical protein RRG08_033030 [Elysia crispata]
MENFSPALCIALADPGRWRRDALRWPLVSPSKNCEHVGCHLSYCMVLVAGSGPEVVTGQSIPGLGTCECHPSYTMVLVAGSGPEVVTGQSIQD